MALALGIFGRAGLLEPVYVRFCELGVILARLLGDQLLGSNDHARYKYIRPQHLHVSVICEMLQRPLLVRTANANIVLYASHLVPYVSAQQPPAAIGTWKLF